MYISNVVFSSVVDVTLNKEQLILELVAVRSGTFKFSNDEFLLSDVCTLWSSGALLDINGMYLINV